MKERERVKDQKPRQGAYEDIRSHWEIVKKRKLVRIRFYRGAALNRFSVYPYLNLP